MNSAESAQRRPGPQPRRHSARRLDRGIGASGCWIRSTKAGASTPATRAGRSPREPIGPHGTRSDARSTKAGASTPATPPRWPPAHLRRTSATSAQRRPGPQPRRHHGRQQSATRCMTVYRSTKAGASTPATRLLEIVSSGRPRDAAPAAAAQRRPGPQPRRHSRWRCATAWLRQVGRSTKAGASTPATLSSGAAAATP